MTSPSLTPATVVRQAPATLLLSGNWTARGSALLARQVAALAPAATAETVADGSRIEALDATGAWLLQGLLRRLRDEGTVLRLEHLRPEFARLLEAVGEQDAARQAAVLPAGSPDSALAGLGRRAATALAETVALLAFVGESAVVLAGCIAHPSRMRWRPLLFNIAAAGVSALPIVGLLSFLLGIVVAYQGSDQLRQYGANIFVADLVGISMLREFAPLITAIIIAGRSGSAYAAQIGTMAVTEEIDAMRTLGIAPLELLVLPKVLALLVALPLLTVFADVLGVFGGMIMAQAQLGVGHAEFLDRFTKVVSVTSFLIGIGKAPVFAAIIAVVGCFQGLRTRGGADSVGRQTTRSVVQASFLVIVADALFSIAFSALDL